MLLSIGVDTGNAATAIGDPQCSIGLSNDRFRTHEVVTGVGEVTQFETKFFDRNGAVAHKRNLSDLILQYRYRAAPTLLAACDGGKKLMQGSFLLYRLLVNTTLLYHAKAFLVWITEGIDASNKKFWPFRTNFYGVQSIAEQHYFLTMER